MPHLAELLGFSGGLNQRVPPVFRSGMLLLALLGVSVAMALMIIQMGYVAGFIFLGLFIGLPIAWIAFNNPLHALIIAIILSYLIFLTRRLSGMYDLPTGTVGDAILVIGALGVLFKKRRTAQPVKNVISITFFIIMAYTFLEVLNPYAYNIEAWLNLGLRTIIIQVSVFVLCLHAFNSLKAVKHFTVVCLSFALIAALYGMYQEWVGLPEFDMKWVMSDPQRYKLFFIAGRFRKWSILGEVSSFGVIMAFTAITTLILSLGPYSWGKKVLLFVAAICMILGMAFSGTRTAYVMLPVGLAFYMLMTIINRRSLIFSAVALVVGLGIFFGPFYGGTLSRIRTAFNPSDDPSMQVREENRDFIQPYMWTHPIGGGIGTVSVFGKKYHPNHFLAGFPPDSGYMVTVLETGYIGLFLAIWLYFVTLLVGVKNYFRSRSPVIRNYYLAYMAAFFAITVGNIAQNAVSYPPADVINICILVLMFRLGYLENNKTSTANETN